MDQMDQIIGRVSAIEKNPSSSEDFFFWLRDNTRVNAFDVVKVTNEADSSITYGMIIEIYHVTDSPGHISNYVSSDFGDVQANPMTKRLGVTFAHVTVLQNTKENYMPLLEDSIVCACNEADVQKALGLDEIDKDSSIPAGIYTTSNGVRVPIYLDRNFLLGPEAAHLNVSGISGLATKTSYIMFLLKAIQSNMKDDVAIVVMNVKGDDLLHLDQPNNLITDDEKEKYRSLEMDCSPFSRVTYFYPFKNTPGSNVCSETSLKDKDLLSQYANNQAFNYVYTYEHDVSKLEMLFSNVDDPNFTIESILNFIDTDSEFRTDLTWDQFKELVSERCRKGDGDTKRREIPVQSWRKFSRLIGNSLKHSLFTNSIAGSSSYRQCYLSDRLKRIKGGDTFVIDIAALDEQMQCLVFGDVIRSVYELKHGDFTENDRRSNIPIPSKIIVFVDELNKYAPSTSPKTSPLLGNLLDITERGRSEGVILFSAEQFKSAVHDRIKGNCSTNVYGRTNAIELSKPDYRYIPDVYRAMIGRLKKGELLLQYPLFNSILRVNFPYPCYEQGGTR